LRNLQKRTGIIDFHTHVFPDHVADRARETLYANTGYSIKPVTDMKVSGLISKMDEWGIDISVLQPVITKASQKEHLNRWTKEQECGRIVAFGGVYPHTDNYKEDIDFVCSLGIKGIKFHPEYQNFVLDEPKMLKIYDYALSKGLILLFHAGYDPISEAPFKSDPQKFLHLIDEMKGGVIVAAHFGGQRQWDEVEKYLAGADIYFDTSVGFEYFTKDQFCRIAKKHGCEKILFASDSPWSNAKTEIEHLRGCPLAEEEKEMILWSNAARILGL